MSPIEYENSNVKHFVESGQYLRRLKNRNSTAKCLNCDFNIEDFFPQVLSDSNAHESKTGHLISIRAHTCGFGLM